MLKRGTLGVHPIGALGVALFVHARAECFIGRGGGGSTEIFRRAGWLRLDEGGVERTIPLAGRVFGNLLEADAHGTLPELLLVCCNPSQLASFTAELTTLSREPGGARAPAERRRRSAARAHSAPPAQRHPGRRSGRDLPPAAYRGPLARPLARRDARDDRAAAGADRPRRLVPGGRPPRRRCADGLPRGAVRIGGLCRRRQLEARQRIDQIFAEHGYPAEHIPNVPAIADRVRQGDDLDRASTSAV